MQIYEYSLVEVVILVCNLLESGSLEGVDIPVDGAIRHLELRREFVNRVVGVAGQKPHQAQHPLYLRLVHNASVSNLL